MPDETSGSRRYSDDEIDRAMRELTEGRAAEPRFREASAAERARQAKQLARQAKKRARKPRGRAKPISALIVVAVLAGGGGLAWLRLGHPSTATGTPTVFAEAPAVPPADPFAGTPADAWANGAAGIVVPTARPVGDFTAAQVAVAYHTTRKRLVAGNLDQQILLGGAPTAFADLLARQQRTQFLAGLNDKQGVRTSTRLWVDSFAPGSTELLGNVTKVKGSMSARSLAVAGGTALAITVNYNFAYAIEPPGRPTDWMRLCGRLTTGT